MALMTIGDAIGQVAIVVHHWNWERVAPTEKIVSYAIASARIETRDGLDFNVQEVVAAALAREHAWQALAMYARMQG